MISPIYEKSSLNLYIARMVQVVKQFIHYKDGTSGKAIDTLQGWYKW